jgi:exopolyphosphatase/guanosine-5'-triphosphate,3'-diphosphate pyrophosphatase
MQDTQRLAAVDLGSNSFRLELGRIEHGQFYRTLYLKETVRQGNGLDDQGHLTMPAMQLGWDCLTRFGEQLAGFNATDVRAVATQTLREAQNRDDFIRIGMEKLGFPIDVISGEEEARLIYLGVAYALPNNNERRLVIDIGGRSTELIVGQGRTPLRVASFHLGSIAWSMRYFANGQFSNTAFQSAENAAQQVLVDALAHFTPVQWEVAYGSAGTINAVADVLVACGWPAGSVTQEGLDWLLNQLLSAQTIDQVQLPGLREDRRAIIGGGLSVLRALFGLLGIQRLEQATGGLRHGLLQDMLYHNRIENNQI